MSKKRTKSRSHWRWLVALAGVGALALAGWRAMVRRKGRKSGPVQPAASEPTVQREEKAGSASPPSAH